MVVSSEDLSSNQCVNELLCALGEQFGVDRAYLFVYHEDRMHMDNSHEWVRAAAGIEAHAERLRGVPIEAFPVFARVTRGEPLLYDRIDEQLPSEAVAEREEVERERIKSMINVPVRCVESGQVLGHIGLDSVRTYRMWSPEEVYLLQQVSLLLSRYIRRQQSPCFPDDGKHRTEPLSMTEWLKQEIASYRSLVLRLLENAAAMSAGPAAAPRPLPIPCIAGLAVGNPGLPIPQEHAARWISRVAGLDSVRARIPAIYKNSMISTRWMANPDFDPAVASPSQFSFFRCLNASEAAGDGQLMQLQLPLLEDRIALFAKHAIPLGRKVAGEALTAAGIDASRIGKVVVVSSTGFLGPGIDVALMDALHLRRDTERCSVSFMGCAAAMNGMRVANDYVRSHPDRAALLVCLEISSLNATFRDSLNDVVLHAIFADGCAAAVIAGDALASVGISPPITGACVSSHPIRLQIIEEFSYLVAESLDGIHLGMDHEAISCTLSPQLPDYIRSSIGAYVDTLLAKQGLSRSNVSFWAVHPGGRRIIEAARDALGLTDNDVRSSWTVLRDYGNMLSPSVLFVLWRILGGTCGHVPSPGSIGVAFSFSPGIGIEGCLLRCTS